jgi:TPR repeat protein
MDQQELSAQSRQPVPASETPRKTSVFISAKSADYGYAREVFQFLKSHGIAVFLSDESLPELGSSDYRKEIDRALDQAEHMVVVTSSLQNVEAAWVEAEWGFFINEKRSARKTGNLITLVTGNLQPRDLPPSLRYYEVLPFQPDAFEKLMRYVGKQPVPSVKSIVEESDSPAPSPVDKLPVPARDLRPAKLDHRQQQATEAEESAEVKQLRKDAERGNATAQSRLGVCYDNGQGIAKDEEEAVRWYRKAAEQGDALAQNNLGACYQGGAGVAKDEEEAVKWYRKAAYRGEASGQFNLGCCYRDGIGMPKDEAEAVKWYRKAAEQGLTMAQTNLGLCYDNGQGIAKDEEEAVRWYRKAAEQGDALAQSNLGACYQNGTGVEKDEEEAVKWYRKGAELGNALSQYNLGSCYDNGTGVPKDKAEAVKWYRKAAEQGDTDALNRLTAVSR